MSQVTLKDLKQFVLSCVINLQFNEAYRCCT